MTRTFEKKSCCCGCGGCAEACPFGAISMKADGEGFLYPSTDRKKCTDCGRCEAVCPLKTAHGETSEGKSLQGAHHAKAGQNRIYLGAQAKDDAVRFASSSGGVFPVLAKYVLSREGVVFGAAMEADGTVRHREVRTPDGVLALQKTKYVQSDLRGCFQKVRQYVREGRLVLFTGLPCQCQAVKRYIGEEKENLLLADLVCYGAPSARIWKKYVRELEKKYGGQLAGFSFRDKRAQDNGQTVSVKIGEKEYAWPLRQDRFCRLYFWNVLLRPSCYVCRFCTVNRESDITMGDFWGIENVKPELEDRMGTSMVILHSEKAVRLWNTVKEEFRYFVCRKEDVTQPRLCGPTVLPKRRRPAFLLLCRFMSLAAAEKLMKKWRENR